MIVRTANALALVLGFLFAAPAMASTVTFDNLDALDSDGVYRENRVTVKAIGGDLGGGGGAAHLDDAYSFARALDFTMARPFNAIGFTLTSLGYNLTEVPKTLKNNIFVKGYAGGKLVAEHELALSDIFLMTQSIVLGDAFSGLDRLRIGIKFVYGPRLCTDSPCAHFDLEDVTLASVSPAPVPLPPGAALLGAAGLALFGIGRRRRRPSA